MKPTELGSYVHAIGSCPFRVSRALSVQFKTIAVNVISLFIVTSFVIALITTWYILIIASLESIRISWKNLLLAGINHWFVVSSHVHELPRLQSPAAQGANTSLVRSSWKNLPLASIKST